MATKFAFVWAGVLLLTVAATTCPVDSAAQDASPNMSTAVKRVFNEPATMWDIGCARLERSLTEEIYDPMGMKVDGEFVTAPPLSSDASVSVLYFPDTDTIRISIYGRCKFPSDQAAAIAAIRAIHHKIAVEDEQFTSAIPSAKNQKLLDLGYHFAHRMAGGEYNSSLDVVAFVRRMSFECRISYGSTLKASGAVLGRWSMQDGALHIKFE